VVENGFFMTVAAGNYAEDAKYESPASEPRVCTVGATTFNDTLAYFSNFGAGIGMCYL
jgi:cerevisin